LKTLKTRKIFFHTQHEAAEHAWGPPGRGYGGSFLRLWAWNKYKNVLSIR